MFQVLKVTVDFQDNLDSRGTLGPWAFLGPLAHQGYQVRLQTLLPFFDGEALCILI